MILLIGISGSGKTAIAKQNGYSPISADTTPGANFQERAANFRKAIEQAPAGAVVELVPLTFLKMLNFLLQRGIKFIYFVECDFSTARRRIEKRLGKDKDSIFIDESVTEFQIKCYDRMMKEVIPFVTARGLTLPPYSIIKNYGETKKELCGLFNRKS